MSSPDKVSVSESDFGLEGGERASVRPAGRRAPRGPGLGLDLGTPRSGEGVGALADPEGFEAEQELIEEGRTVLWGREGRPGTPTDEMGNDPDYESLLADDCAAIVQPLSHWAIRGVRRHPCSEGRDTQVSTVWPHPGAGLSGSGAMATSAAPARPIGPRKVRAPGIPKRGAKSKLRVGRRIVHRPYKEGLVQPPSDPEPTDEFSEVPMRVSIHPKAGVQGEPSSAEDPGDTPRHSSLLVREDILCKPGSFLSSPPRGLTSGMERQVSGQLDSSSSEKMQSVVWGKAGSRPSFPGAAAAAVGSLPRAVPRKKEAQGNKCLGDASNLALGRAFPPWGQRLSAVPLEPATLPPITGVPLLGRSKRYSLLSSGPKDSKHSSTGKKCGVRKAKDSKPVARDDNDPNRDLDPKAQLQTPRPGPPCQHMHPGEFSSGDQNTRAPQVPRNSQASALRQGGATTRGPAPSSDQEPPVHAPRAERQQQPPGTQGCPLCAALERDIQDLKEQLVNLFTHVAIKGTAQAFLTSDMTLCRAVPGPSLMTFASLNSSGPRLSSGPRCYCVSQEAAGYK
ncbi:PREDICTED: uncharacterized protein CXorf49-like [Propithecus coquereli]|uniref:uncharacterized protein CXorf49-like n=1 Tax=Propithecus coquereli TaxID=379532 RepID=UPI00063F8616|nr:PREDICTED: uncharacterized protein CXorf49-like [Propithecus coquereli]